MKHPLSWLSFQAVRWLASKAHSISALYGSHTAVPIVCDASNARTVAVREYHYLTRQVMAGK
ncbi:conjugal transfer protein [Blautia pseudococcoides]|nr:conjugal transfer protein [Blautia pseudococcoides]